ncbi:DUF3313 domain-containing protein [Corallincola luteus]|uniref:DUF3313 domain-containing protein n=1 Tax=Corallincola luteus TaxID=1775177 RepID=A0ABY2ASS0_9GAMM|nr:DUF3313 domain-containing protein [Corallincola luteus]TCI05152.1 DUF3313 domain-containing protein [Corallincola luteus]
MKLFQSAFCMISAIVFASGCASAPDLDQSHSGFLSNYNKLAEVEGEDHLLRYRNDNADLSTFSSITVAPTTTMIADSMATDSSLTVEQQQQLAVHFANQMQNKIGNEVLLSGDGNPLLLRSAFTGITNTSEDLAFYQYIPVALIVTGIKEAAGKRDKIPMMFLEFELTDKTTGEVIMQSMRRVQLDEISPEELEEQGAAAILPRIDSAVEQFEQVLRDTVNKLEQERQAS